MKIIVLLFVVSLLFYSCGTVYFTTPQPQKGMVLKSFIASVQGEYSDSLLTISVLKNEVKINNDTFKLVAGTPGNNEVVVKFYNNFYFASFKDSSYFNVFMGNFYENKLAIYTLNADSRSVEVLKRFVDVQTIDKENETYLIDANKKQFDELIENEQFKVLGVLQKK